MDEAYERNLYENTLQQEDFPSRCLFSDAERATARGSGPEACVITGGTPGLTRTDGARSGSGGRTASPVGLHRVIDPAGALPQAAWRLDPSPELWPDETRVRVDRLNLDAASFRQLTVGS
jgi:hypothetical protein